MNPHHSPDQNDIQIDRVLSALRNTTPPIGMNRRILNILEARSSLKGVSKNIAPVRGVIPSGAKRSRGIPAFSNASTGKYLRWTTTAAVATLAAVALIPLTQRHTLSPTAGTQQITSQLPAPQTPTAITVTVQSSYKSFAPLRPSRPRRIETSLSEETTPISHPAPPLPLTEQEKLLLRFARQSHPNDLVQISGEVKAAKEAQEAAEFTAFFAPPPPPQ
ncbi:MAG: hypothetical protein JST61_02975 [Acidobacteria bacterium]|nr:hypothetical protein [Acidobacteriota bacterium]